jgi:hypothetical protein
MLVFDLAATATLAGFGDTRALAEGGRLRRESWGHCIGSHRHQKGRYRKDHKYALHYLSPPSLASCGVEEQAAPTPVS